MGGMPDVKVIDYDHAAPGTTCNGVISVMDGAGEAGAGVEAIWTWEVDGHLTTCTEHPPQAVVAEMWDRIAGSLARGGVFSRHRVVNPTRMADAEAAHLIVAVVEEEGELVSYTFAVPANEADPEFVSWMGLLAVPTGGGRPEHAQ